MVAPEHAPGMTLADVERTVRAAVPAALFIEPRILRRVIKQDRRLSGIGFQMPHADVYTIKRERLLVIADRPELDLAPAADLPPYVILLPRPEHEDEILPPGYTARLLHDYWRLLFHARIHVELESLVDAKSLDEAAVGRRIEQIGLVEFAEIRRVLTQDDLLAPQHSQIDAYVEFTAVALELLQFAPEQRPLFFPAVRDWNRVDQLLSADVDQAQLFRTTQPDGASPKAPHSDAAALKSVEAGTTEQPAEAVPARRYAKLIQKAEKAASVGNNVKAAMLRMVAARIGDPQQQETTRDSAAAELHELAERLQRVYDLTEDETDRWARALTALLEPAADGYRRTEARLLYDLQKACLAHERGFFRFAWRSWFQSRGRIPLRRPLPILQQVLITKALRTAARRVSTIRLAAEDRRQLELLLDDVVSRSQRAMRDDVRPRIVAVFDDVGLVPDNTPEEITRRKLIEELLDRVEERGFLNMGDVRDALSQNDLKLPDLSGVVELVSGDKLLRADRKLGIALEGVYRPGAIYLRMTQRLSSLAFGVPTGRFLVQYVVLPFGGAYLGLEAIRHVVGGIVGAEAASRGSGQPLPTDPLAETSPTALNWPFLASVLIVGVLLLLIMHRPKFRAWLGRTLLKLWRFLRKLVVDLPAEILRKPWVRRVLDSQTFAVFRNYIVRPAVVSLIAAGVAWWLGAPWSRDFAVQFFLAANLFLNSPIGRFFEEWLTDVLVRAWHELRIRVLAAAFHWIMDVFHLLLEWVERFLYIVDEWLRFRPGDSRAFVGAKLVLGTIWAMVAYVIRFCMTLLVEPQVNPIKHFPVVTVSHKILIPFTPHLITLLVPLVGGIAAPTLATTTIFLLPGVFGFLVWELKGNWRLYEANRSESLAPAPMGRYGETMTALLRPGIHSGTLPKLFSKLRRALNYARHDEHDRAARKQLAAIDGVRLSVERFVNRTLCQTLSLCEFTRGNPMRVEQVATATNRIEIEVDNGQFSAGPLSLTFEDNSGWLVATVRNPGWLAEVDPDSRERVNTALAGFYKRAGVDLVRENFQERFPRPELQTRFQEDGALVFTGENPRRGAVYKLRTSARMLAPLLQPEARPGDWPVVEREALVFADCPITWDEWVRAWTPAAPSDVSPEVEQFPHVMAPSGA